MLAIYVRTSKDDTENSIEQQKQAGIAFASKNHIDDFAIYEDEGKSGYKIADDEDDKFKNRPAFSQLYKDIHDKKIDMVWVWEHSRLSRNQYASALIFYDFEKGNIKVYVKDSLYDFKDKNAKLMRGILDVMAEYERELIVSRTTRGLHDKINKGERTHGKLYGYQKTGVDANGLQILEPVESEVENIKYGYKRILEGATLRQLTLELYQRKRIKKQEALQLSLKWHKILMHFDYTGFALNMEGLKVFKDFKEFKIDNLSALHDQQYYVKSKNYKVKIVSIEKWIKVAERLQVNSKIRQEYRINKASTELATGLIVCSECGKKYYSFKHGGTRDDKSFEYTYYKHYASMSKIECNQKKSFAVGNIDEIFKTFYFLNYIVYDNTKESFEETIRLLKQGQLESGERIKSIEKEINQADRNIKKFEAAIDETDDTGTITILAKRISTEEERRKNLNIETSKLKVELEKLKIKQSRTEMENVYYNATDKVKEFFYAKSLEAKRDMLVKAIQKCLVMSNCILIDTGFNLYVFDTTARYKFDENKIKNLDDETDYKYHYTGIADHWKNRKQDEKMDHALMVAEDSYENIYLDPYTVADEPENIDEMMAEYHIKYDYSKCQDVIFVIKD